MKRRTNPITGSVPGRALADLALTLALVLLPAVTLRADAPPAALRIANSGPDTEGLPTFRLDWDASSNATYLVQSATSLAPGAPWNTLDAVTPADKAGSYQFQVVATDSTGLSSPPARFYRLVLPQPHISSVEPAIVAPGVAVDFYVSGQCFPTNAVLQINGVTQAGAVVLSPSLATVPSFTPDLPGNYQFSLAVGGVVVSSFNVVCADALSNPEQVLQGPPTDPPASPSKKDFKGHVTLLKAFDDEAGDAEAKKDFKGHVTLLKAFDDECDGSSARGHTKTGHVTLMKAFDDGSDDTRARPGRGRPIKITVTGMFGSRNTSVMPFSGEVQECDVDMAIAGRGLDFVLARTYRSRTHHTATILGNCWSLSYDVSVEQGSTGITVNDGTGRKDTFTLQPNGTYTCPEFFREGTFSNGIFRLTFADAGRWEFNPLDGTAAAGKLAHIMNGNGDVITLIYDGQGRLAQVVDDLDRTNTVGYNPAGQLASVTDFSGRSVNYAYYQLGETGGGPGDLKSVTSPPVTGTPNGNDFPDGKTVTYTYSTGYANDAENHLLLSVIDDNGKAAYTHVYQHNQTDFEFLHCIASQEGTSKTERITVLPQLATPANHFAVVRSIINDPVGNVAECFFDARNRCVMERDYTGRATPEVPVTDTANRPAGKLRTDDPDYYETRWSWNNDSLCTLEVAAGGQQLQCVYQTDFDPTTPARKRADCRVVRELATGGVDLDGDGVADVNDRTWRYDYDPRFGSDPGSMACNPAEGTVRWHVARGVIDGGLAIDANTGINEKLPFASLHTNVRQRVLDLENVLKNLGLLSRTSGGRRFGIGDTSPASPLGRMGRPAINTALNNQWDGMVPAGNGMAIKTKGTGADKNRVSSSQPRIIDNQKGLLADFCISATDPRGNVTTGTYDANGNRVKVKFYWDRQSSADEDFAYDTHGQVITITNAADANGRRSVTTVGWALGHINDLVVDAGADGLQLHAMFEHDSRGNVTRVVDPRTNDWLYTYNALDQCVRVQTPINLTSRCTTDFAYDANDNLAQSSTEVRDDTDTKLADKASTFDYDPMNRLIRVTEPISAKISSVTEFAYDDNNQLTEIRSPLAVVGFDSHQIQAFTYDERGLLFQATAAPGTGLCGTNEYSYTANGQLATKKYVDDGDALKADFAYDGFDRLASATDPMGNVMSCTYDCNDNLVHYRMDAESVDAPGSAGNHRYAECRWKYDALDRCVQSSKAFFDPATQSPIGSGVAVSSCTYAPNGDCVSETDSLGRTTSYAYDTAGRPASVASPGGKSIVVSARDAFGNATRCTQTDTPDLGGPAQVFYTTCTYDSLNRCVSSSDNVGNTYSCTYDSLDRVVRATDPNGNDTTYAYDYLGNCLASTEYVGPSSALPSTVISSSQAAYDVSSRCVSSTDANGNTTSYNYDSLNRLLNTVCADGTACHLVWSPRSNLIAEEDANGTTITNVYDLCDRIIHRDIAARGPAAATTTFETFAYDGCSQLIMASNDISRLDFSYDSLGNTIGGSQDGLTQSATHDSEGNLLSLTYPSGRVVTYSYDALDQVNNIATTGGGSVHAHLAQFTYAGPGRLASVGRDNGINSQIDWDGLISPPNTAGDYGWQQVSRIHHGTTQDTSSLVDITGTYDRMQSKSSQTDSVSGRSLALTYDALDQLVESSLQLNGTPVLDTLYSLDADGNRQHVITNGTPMLPDYAMSSALPPGDFFMNRYTDTPFGAQQYDANGNLILRATATSPTFYHYDYADRLVEVDALNGEGFVAPVATFTYDALGHRISKTTYPGVPAAPVTTQYVYGDPDSDNDGILELRQSGTLIDSYIHKLDDGIIARCDAAGQAQFFHGDDLDNTLALTDAGGNVLERYAYDDYGQPQFLAADGSLLVDGAGQPLTTSSLGNLFLFHGAEWDGETGLLCDDGSDYFDPQTGHDIRGKVKTIKDMGHGRGGFAIESRDILKSYFETGDIPTQDQRQLPRNVLKSFFATGDKPTQAQFGTLIDSMVNRLDDRNLLGLRVFGMGGNNNPWSGGSPSAMKKGTVKFFNEAKGFGMVVGGGSKTHTKTGHVTLMK